MQSNTRKNATREATALSMSLLAVVIGAGGMSAQGLAPTTLAESRSNIETQTPVSLDKGKNRGVPYDYQIGAGDVLQISVWKEPDASVPSAVVRPDGKISMPILKEFGVLGMTPAQAEAAITEKLSHVIKGADVTVVVTTITSKKVYLMGAVRREGPLAYTYRMTVLQALNEAGGLTEYAKRKKVYVLRNDGAKQSRIPVNYDALLKGDHLEQDVTLLPNDMIVVPQ